MSKTVLVAGGLASSLLNFRLALLRELVARGHGVVACAAEEDPAVRECLGQLNIPYHSVRLKRAKTNPVGDLAYWVDMVRMMRRIKPEVVLGYTIKPVIYGGLAARSCGVPFIYSLVTGLGYAFMESSSFRQRCISRLVRLLYRASLRHSHRVFFQNPDDARAFVEMKLVNEDQVILVNGSGVDLQQFPFVDPSGWREGIRFLLIARLLKDKGIMEYAEAARRIHLCCPRAEFHLVGPFDTNPSALSREAIASWEKEGWLRFHGEQADVRPSLCQCQVYVLPSYREGTPRSVLEAMATGRAIITTDAPGCRETVRKPDKGWQILKGKSKIGTNGILVPPRDASALADAMDYFIQHPEEIKRMGMESRRYAEERYDVHRVNAVMLEAMGL